MNNGCGKTSGAARILAVSICISVLCATGWTAELSETEESTVNSNQVQQLIRGLGSNTYRIRQAAFEALKTESRGIIPLLQPYSESADPELRLRVRELIQHLMSDPAKIPQRFFAFVEPGPIEKDLSARQRAWSAAITEWTAQSVMCASNFTGHVGGGFYSQSFVPHCDRITAVLLCVFPINHAWGWLRLDLREDAGGQPSRNVLARSWLRVDKDCPVPFNGFMIFALPKTEVRPNATYWLVFNEFLDPDSPPNSSIYNAGLSNNDQYREGVQRDWWSGLKDLDVKFGILSPTTDFPLLRRATNKQLTTLPADQNEKQLSR